MNKLNTIGTIAPLVLLTSCATLGQERTENPELDAFFDNIEKLSKAEPDQTFLDCGSRSTYETSQGDLVVYLVNQESVWPIYDQYIVNRETDVLCSKLTQYPGSMILFADDISQSTGFLVDRQTEQDRTLKYVFRHGFSYDHPKIRLEVDGDLMKIVAEAAGGIENE